MVLLRHTAKHGEQVAVELLHVAGIVLDPCKASGGRFPEAFSEGSAFLRVQVVAAADLSMGSKSLPVPYCALATGYRDQPWAAKAAGQPECNTAPELRQRNPRWNARCRLQMPKAYVSPSRVEFCKDEVAPQELELSVRVMDAGGLRGDRVAGEARISLEQARGAGTFRLLGGGYASISVRWSKGGEEGLDDFGTREHFENFEQAIHFWSQQDLSSPTGVARAQKEFEAGSCLKGRVALLVTDRPVFCSWVHIPISMI